jgi:thiamine-monophosphate kinase
MVAGVLFLPDDPPAETIGRKLLRVNLSDLAAMGAAPLGYLMTCGFPPPARRPVDRSLPRAWLPTSWNSGSPCWAADTVATPGPATSP